MVNFWLVSLFLFLGILSVSVRLMLVLVEWYGGVMNVVEIFMEYVLVVVMMELYRELSLERC